MLKHAVYDRFVNCERREEEGGGRFVTMKPCDRGRGSSVLLIKVDVKYLQFIGKSSVGSGSILWRRLIVGYGLQTCRMLLELLVVRFSSNLSRYLALPVLMAFSAEYLAFLYLSLSLYASCFACILI